MAYIRKYQSLFSINASQPYYAIGSFEDLEIIPDAITQQLFRGFKWKARLLDSAIEVYYESTKNGIVFEPVVPGTEIEDYKIFTFLIRAKAGRFPLITKLKDISDGQYGELAGKVFYFDNLHVNSSILLDLNEYPGPSKTARISAKIANYEFEDAAITAPVTLNVFGPEVDYPPAGTPLISIDITQKQGDFFRAEVDLREDPDGRYIFQLEKSGTGVLDTAQYYASDTLIRNKPFGIIVIRKPATNDWWTTPGEYDLRFTNIDLVWRYHFVYKSGTYSPPDPGAVYKVVDSNAMPLKFAYEGTTTGPNGFERASFYTSTAESSGSGPAGTPPAPGNVVYKSMTDDALPGIQLIANIGGVGDEIIIDNLPNAAVENVYRDPTTGVLFGEIYVYL